MDHNQIKVSLLKNNSGMVLALVLIVMVATIIVGVTLISNSTVETKIVGNERAYNQNFLSAESAAEYVIPMFDAVASANIWNVDNVRDISAQLQTPTTPAIIAGATVEMTLRRTGTPPVGSGTSAANSEAYYFRIRSVSNDQDVETGVWKAFPKSE